MPLSNQRGFTLIELLVVLGIIGILAAIGVPAFLGQSGKAQDTRAKSHLSAAGKAVEELGSESGYAALTVASLREMQPSLDEATALTFAGAQNSYAVTVQSASGTTFSLERTGAGAVVHDCSVHGSGGCAATADGQGNYW